MCDVEWVCVVFRVCSVSITVYASGRLDCLDKCNQQHACMGFRHWLHSCLGLDTGLGGDGVVGVHELLRGLGGGGSEVGHDLPVVHDPHSPGPVAILHTEILQERAVKVGEEAQGVGALLGAAPLCHLIGLLVGVLNDHCQHGLHLAAHSAGYQPQLRKADVVLLDSRVLLHGRLTSRVQECRQSLIGPVAGRSNDHSLVLGDVISLELLVFNVDPSG
mmetsp:Transcript_32985/g.55177  ORF Transcript_32985/g.55177 Transcript_32985/m.55177 type:complete len:218 (+) Transcript_32985:1333-1986(+)